MVKKYLFRENYSQNLMAFLSENKIKYTEKKNDFIGMHLITFTVDNPQLAEQLLAFAKNEPIIEVKYSQKELESASLIRIHAKRQEVNVINSADAFEFGCKIVDQNGIGRAYHKEQVRSVKIDKCPKEKKGSVLYSPIVGFGELFADARFYELCKKNKLAGIRFLPVYDKKGAEQQGLWQVTADGVISVSDIVLGYGEKMISCPVCNQKKIVPPQAYELHVKAMNVEQDFYVTERVFGEGISDPYFLISQRLYQLLAAEGLLNDLVLIPVAFC